uniref:F-box/LRR-repeat protein At3g28410 n=1 Tax=Nicotiana tabacum TaxID=4097 RepID=A0A1S4AGT6_TOBAC|nr:PREDICTED: putative F-box/LRR-repeat protein At3g28410 [Nicotiana tabacum]
MRRKATANILPECVIHKILSYLRYEEATHMRILSKTWLQAWLTHPKLEFTFDFHKGNMKIVDKVMERYKDGKIPIEKFELTKVSDSVSYECEAFPLIEKWLGIALQNGVKDLEFTYINTQFSGSLCSLPIFALLAAKSLRELVLSRCDLMHHSLSASHVANWGSLRKLSLRRVDLEDNMLRTLLTSCPLIVTFILEYCSRLKKIELRNLQKIRSVSIKIEKDQRVILQAPTLEHFSYSSYSFKGLNIVECKNLKSLELSSSRISGFPEHLISTSQFLESLILKVRNSRRLRAFNICGSQSLKHLKIQDSWGIIREIDAPNLFGGLRKFLSNSASCSQVTIRFDKGIEFSRKNLQLQHRVIAPQVDVLDLDIDSPGKCPTIVDALLWSCHPRRLDLQSTSEMITCFIDRLTYMKNSSHSTSHGSNLGLSQLKEVKAYTRNNQPVELGNGELAKGEIVGDRLYSFFTSSTDNCAEVEP